MRIRNMGNYLSAKEHGMKVYIPIATIGFRRQPCNKPCGRARDAIKYGKDVSDRYIRLKAAEEIQ